MLSGGVQIPELSEYAVFGFERQARVKRGEGYNSVTLSPIAPFGISVRCFAYELLAIAGLDNLSDFDSCQIDDETIKGLSAKVQKALDKQPGLLSASTSLGVVYDLRADAHYQAKGNFERGVINNEILRGCIGIAREFTAFLRSSAKASDFFAAYASESGSIPTKEVIGYLAAFPVASTMRKQGHF